MNLSSKTWEPHDFPATPHLLYPFIEACTRNLRVIAGISYHDTACFIKDKQARWGYCEQDMERIGEHMFNNPEEVIELAEQWPKYVDDFNRVCTKIKNLTKLSYDELLKLYREFYKEYINQYAIPILANSFDFYFENWLKARVESHDDFLVLVSPSKESFIQKEMKELLSIKKDHKFHENIEKHANKYFWLGNNYVQTKILDKDHFIERHKSEICIKPKRINKRPLMKKYNISPALIMAAEECIFWRDERKKYNMIANHYLCLLLEEIGKRNNISLEDMKYTLPYEIGKIDKNRISERKKAFLILTSEDVYHGDTALELHKKMYADEMPEKEVKGRPACLGKAKGTVKVIMNEKEFHKMQENDILVTSMTRPEFVPLMKKAAAIITDEGGITCHAAIVSRELNKPCIISTRIATKVLKDEDMVEVDAEKGIVRRV